MTHGVWRSSVRPSAGKTHTHKKTLLLSLKRVITCYYNLLPVSTNYYKSLNVITGYYKLLQVVLRY